MEEYVPSLRNEISVAQKIALYAFVAMISVNAQHFEFAAS